MVGPSQTPLASHSVASPSAAAPERAAARTPTISLLLEPVRDPAAREVVRRQLDLHAVPGQDADEVHAHLAADVRPHDREAVPLHVHLDGVRDVGETPARPALLDGLIEALTGDVEQLLHLRRHVADGEGERAVRVVPVHDTPEVQADDIALLDAAVGRGNPVHDLLVDRDADGGREAAVALEGRLGAARRDEALHVLVDLERRQARLHEAAQVLDDVGEDMAGRAHQTDLTGRLQLDHARAPAAAPRMAPRMVSMVPSPGTETSRPRPRYQSSSGAVCRAYTPRRWRTVASLSSSRW